MTEFVPAHLAIKSMRSNGYRNTAYAVAELIDNSIQAGATYVQLLCFDDIDRQNQKHVSKIVVIDDGCGMNQDVLQLCLQFGNGTRLESKKQEGLGKFGMGLPSASISQCRRVEVYSWQNGVESAQFTFMDLDEIQNKSLKSVPTPCKKNLPDFIKSVEGLKLGRTGTAVVWSNIDKCFWKQGVTVIRNSEDLIGRIYRYFIENLQITISMKSIDLRTGVITENRSARPNDPLYLMKETTCPAPWDKEPMFQQFESDATMDVVYQGEKHAVKIKYSLAKNEARERKNGHEAGGQAHGKHAAKNIGISVLRAGREIELNQSICLPDVTERWWGVEVDFPPALDDVFGVSNNKQSAHNFSELLDSQHEIEWSTSNKSPTAYTEQLRQIGDPRADLVQIVQKIKQQIRLMRQMVKTQQENTRTKRKFAETGEVSSDSSAERATSETTKRALRGKIGEADRTNITDPIVKEKEVDRALIESVTDPAIRKHVAQSIVQKGLKYSFQKKAWDGSSFFTVSPRAGVIFVDINTDHPAYSELFQVLDTEEEELDSQAIREKLDKALYSIKLLLMAWARFEDEQPPDRRSQLQEIRQDWGIITRDFLKKE